MLYYFKKMLTQRLRNGSRAVAAGKLISVTTSVLRLHFKSRLHLSGSRKFTIQSLKKINVSSSANKNWILTCLI